MKKKNIINYLVFFLALLILIIGYRNNSTYFNKKENKDVQVEYVKDNAANKEQKKKEQQCDIENKQDEKKHKEPKEEVSVYIRVEGYNKTIIPRTEVTVGVFDMNPYIGPASGSSATVSKGWEEEKFKHPTVVHAIVNALEESGYKNKRDYDLQDYGWSLYMAMIDGEREFDYRSTSGWMYRVNDVLPNIGCNAKEIRNGNEIVWYFGAYGFDTVYTKMKANQTEIDIGNTVTLTLNGLINNKDTWEQFEEPVSGAGIYVNGKEFKVKGEKVITDEDGQATLSFHKPGKYVVSAERFKKGKRDREGIRDMVRPVPITIVVQKK
jgi:hypothetical protein